MGCKQITIKVPTAYTDDLLRSLISKKVGLREFTWQIESKSLDARNKSNIHWVMRIAVFSENIKGEDAPKTKTLEIPWRKRKEKILITGSGPAGFFCALLLQQAGFKTLVIERGSEVLKRNRAILDFERRGMFDPANNYAFGEGGAGTFSDGKLTSRSKHISAERRLILSKYIEAGAPEEIAYMTHPHLGTDNLKKIVKNLREEYRKMGGELQFDTMLEDISIQKGRVKEVLTSSGNFQANAVFIAPGHSAFETYRMLMKRGVAFRTKNFAIGSRMEHPQELINRAQWGKPELPGVKAAEYRLSSAADGKHQVYSFCMCPGGMVVPATAYAHTNIVNGMSYYKRDGLFANAACVAALHPDELAGKTVTPAEALDQLEKLEETFFLSANGYAAPSCSITDFLNSRQKDAELKSSYPLGLTPAPLWEMLPAGTVNAMKAGLRDFSRKLKGFETGNLIGLESKTSSPIQVIREEGGRCSGFENLFLIGEGSGYAGGIISSAADGVKAAMNFLSGK